MNPVVFILGPTCAGKTNLAFHLAYSMGTSMINADSLQMYKYLNIGSAKPHFEKHPEIEHYLFDHVTPPDVYTAGQYCKQAQLILKKILPHKISLVVGGSGFYIQALEKGCYPVSASQIPIRNQILKEESQCGLSSLYQELQESDPEYAKKIHPKDKYRIVRALSLIRGNGIKISQVEKIFKPTAFPFTYFKIGMTSSKEVLRKRVSIRVREMMKKGLILEVQSLLDKGLEDFPPMESVGYKECAMYLKGKIKEIELEELITIRTMKLIKKQKVWFKRDKSIRWYDCEVDYKEVEEDLKNQITNK